MYDEIGRKLWRERVIDNKICEKILIFIDGFGRKKIKEYMIKVIIGKKNDGN